MVILLVLSSKFYLIPFISPVEHSSGSSIRVMSFNVHLYLTGEETPLSEKTGAFIFSELEGIIKDINPDIIGLQESEGNRLLSGTSDGVAWLASRLNMHYYYGPPTSAQIYGVSILSKWPIIQQEWKPMPLVDGIERALVSVKIDSPFGILNIYNSHFEIEVFLEDQEKQAQFVLDQIGSEPAIFLCDCNTNYTESTFQLLNESLTYSWIEAGNQPSDIAGATFSASNKTAKIDYIWLTSGDWSVTVGSAKTYGNRQASDHLAIVADISPI